MSTALLEVRNLVTEFDTDEGRVRAVDDVSFTVDAGQTLGVVGESGCGKSVTALSIMRLLPQPMGQVSSGQIIFEGRDLAALALPDMEKVRGAAIGMVFQEPMTALKPLHTVGKQLAYARSRRLLCEVNTRVSVFIEDYNARERVSTAFL